MQTVKIRGHFLETYNGDFCAAIAKGLVPKKLVLLLEYTEREKFMNVANNLAASKTPISRRGTDILLTVNIDPLVMVFTNVDGVAVASSLPDILGNEVTAELRVQRYSLVSKFEKNLGERVTGVHATLKSLSVSK
jgi:hypothetical protein